MRRIVSSTYVSLDGLIEHLDGWHFDYLDDNSAKVEADQLAASDALLMGRRTYEGFAAAWPSRTGDFADKINSMPKYVVSTTLKTPDWTNSTVINGDLVREVAELKQQPGQDILMYGFGPVAHTLLRHRLLDELRLWVHPVFAGMGSPGELLYRQGNTARLELVDTKPLPSGVVILAYQPAANNAPGAQDS